MLENARVLATVLQDRGLRIVSGGTDSPHVPASTCGPRRSPARTPRRRSAAPHITVNKNAIPNDPEKPLRHQPASASAARRSRRAASPRSNARSSRI